VDLVLRFNRLQRVKNIVILQCVNVNDLFEKIETSGNAEFVWFVFV